MCALGSNPWSKELRRVEVGLKIPDYLSRGNGGRLVDCENAFDDFACVFGHHAVEEEGGRAHGNLEEAYSDQCFSLKEPQKQGSEGGL